MYTEEIYCAAKMIGGNDPAGLELFCRSAEEMLLRNLKPGISPEEFKETFITAAALTALSMVQTAAGGTDEVSSYSAGSVSVTRKSSQSIESGKDSLLRQAELLLAPYTLGGDFAFLGVRG